MARTYTSEAIVLAAKKYSEADRILVVYSKYGGKVSLIAKGVRKLKSRKRGSLEVFNQIKFSAANSHGLDIITEVETITSFEKIRTNLTKTSVAYYFVEVIGKLTREAEKHQEVFTTLVKYLTKLERSESVKRLGKGQSLRVLKEEFTKEILVVLGFWPKDKQLDNPDFVLENIAERKIHSTRVGKKLLT